MPAGFWVFSFKERNILFTLLFRILTLCQMALHGERALLLLKRGKLFLVWERLGYLAGREKNSALGICHFRIDGDTLLFAPILVTLLNVRRKDSNSAISLKKDNSAMAIKDGNSASAPEW